MSRIIYSSIILLSAIIAILLNYTGNLDLYKYFKPLTTILIIGFPLLFWNDAKPKYNITILIALVFCLVGDVFLLDDDMFIYGLGSFLIGHLFFTIAIISLLEFNKNFFPLIILIAIGGSYFLFLSPYLGSYKIPVLVYISVIMFMNWQAISLYLNDKRKAYLLIGVAAVLFAFSDSAIAFNKFVNAFELSSFLVLSTYWAAIFLFAFSTQWLKKD